MLPTPPQHSLAHEDGTGIVMAGGGPVESLPVPYRKFPALKGKSLPPIVLLPQTGMGMGAKLLRALKRGEDEAVYGGEYIRTTGTGGLLHAYPSQYSVRVIGVDSFDVFICYAAQTPKWQFKWFIDNNVAGLPVFMNWRNGVGFDINCYLDRNSAWLDCDGGASYEEDSSCAATISRRISFLFKLAVNDGTDSRSQLELETGSSESSPPSQSESSARHPSDSAASTTSEIFMTPPER
jgi:hypothetical protein